MDRAVKAAEEAFKNGEWSKMSARDRGKLLFRLVSTSWPGGAGVQQSAQLESKKAFLYLYLYLDVLTKILVKSSVYFMKQSLFFFNRNIHNGSLKALVLN